MIHRNYCGHEERAGHRRFGCGRDGERRLFGRGRAFGSEDGPEFGGGGRGDWRFGGGRRFGRGDLRYLLLAQLAGQPAHGYELMRALEDRFHGFYTPSPGTVYPTLQWLEDLGYVTATEAEGRKVYTITDAGRAFLADGEARVAAIRERMRGWMGPLDRQEYRAEIEAIERELAEMAHTLRRAGRGAGRDRLRRAREVIRQARREMENVLEELGEDAPASPPDPLS